MIIPIAANTSEYIAFFVNSFFTTWLTANISVLTLCFDSNSLFSSLIASFSITSSIIIV